jgi:hypothetical protein
MSRRILAVLADTWTAAAWHGTAKECCGTASRHWYGGAWLGGVRLGVAFAAEAWRGPAGRGWARNGPASRFWCG